MKKMLICSTIFVLLLMVCTVQLSVPSFAAGNRVSITLPSFNVTMNGQTINNDYSKYPLIVYNGITYFPMTYNDCRFLGIESTWKDDKAGLFVNATGITAAYHPIPASAKNQKNSTASIVSFPVTVNGKVIDNSKEEYPLLSFRDISYFPMTWKYSVDEFGWDFTFDGTNGLVIKSANAKLDQIQIPKGRIVEAYGDFEGKKSTAVMAKNGFVYYVSDKGAIMQAPLSDVSKSVPIFQLEIWSYGDGIQLDSHSFYEENGKAMLYFHSGGAVMGSDHRYLLKEDATVQRIQSSYYETTLINDKLYMYWIGPTPGPGNLWVCDTNSPDGEGVRLGSSDYWYYAFCKVNGLPNLTLTGNELYVRAARVLDGKDENGNLLLANTAVYTVNIATGEVKQISQSKEKVTNAQIAGDFLYYVSVSGEGEECIQSVYKHSIGSGAETLVGRFKGEEYWSQSVAVVGEHIYHGSDGTLYNLKSGKSLNPGAEVIRMAITGDNNEYLACTFKETPQSAYRIMIFDQSGNTVFKTSDSGSNVIVEGNTLFFYNISTETLCKTTI